MKPAPPAPELIAPALDLAGDGDELDLILAIEESFGVELDDEAEGWRTVGDIADWLEGRVGARSSGPRCASAMTFYRLRAALGDRRLTPESRLAECLPGSPDAALKRLAEQTKLRLPATRPGLLGRIGAWLLFAAFAALFGLLFGLSPWVVAGLAAAGLVLVHLDRGEHPVATLGQLAEAAAASNQSRLAALGARQDRDTVWRSLVRLAEEHAGAAPGTVGRETRIIA